jgi:hypothetical protein
MDDKDWKKIEKQVKKLEKLSRGILNIVIKNWDYFKRGQNILHGR